MNGSFLEFVALHRWRILLVILGIVLLVLILTLGFWLTLLIAGIVVICYFLGSVLDKDGAGGVKSLFKALFKGKDF